MFIAQGALVRAARVRLLVLDLDGTLTSGETWFRPGQEQLRRSMTATTPACRWRTMPAYARR